MLRRGGVTVACNWGDAPVTVAVENGVVPHLLSGGAAAVDGRVELEPDSVAVLVGPSVVRARGVPRP